MSLFLLDVLEAWSDQFILLVLDGAGWHKARTLPVPERLRLPRPLRLSKLGNYPAG